MKRKFFLIISLLLIAINLSSCDFLSQLGCEHEYTLEVISVANCTDSGLVKKTCDKCGKIVDEVVEPLGHLFEKCEIIKEATVSTNGEGIKTCSRCGYSENYDILALCYNNIEPLLFDFNEEEKYIVSTMDEVILMFDSALVNFAKKANCVISKKVSMDDIKEAIIEKSTIEMNYELTISLSETIFGNNTNILFGFSYGFNPIRKASEGNLYTQYESLNYSKYVSSRSASFDDFKINSKNYSFMVKNSEQLYYALQCGLMPICEQNSNAEKIYEEAKKVLREIVDDSMSDLEKLIAIHDWLIMNVTYDKALVELLDSSGSVINSQEYRGFFLEGVFLDKRAVCDGISKAFVVLAAIEGIPCVQVTARTKANPNGSGHAWNKVYLDGKWYVIDVTSDGTVVNDSYEILSYEFFLVKEEKMYDKYIPDNFIDYVCDSDYDIYEKLRFTYNNNKYSLVVHNFEELKILMRFFEENAKVNTTLQFKFAYSNAENYLNEIGKAYLAVKKPFSSFSTPAAIIADNICTIVR